MNDELLKSQLDKLEIDFIFLVAPTTTDERLKHIAKIATGYIYYVSLKGVTGAGNLDIDSVNQHLSRMKNYIKLPVGVISGIFKTLIFILLQFKLDPIVEGAFIIVG